MTELGKIIELSHVIRHGQVTLPGFPPPEIGTFLGREASRGRYAPGVELHIASISMIANTGTYLDTPFHRATRTRWTWPSSSWMAARRWWASTV